MKKTGCKHKDSPILQNASSKNKDILLHNHANIITTKNINNRKRILIILYYQTSSLHSNFSNYLKNIFHSCRPNKRSSNPGWNQGSLNAFGCQVFSVSVNLEESSCFPPTPTPPAVILTFLEEPRPAALYNLPHPEFCILLPSC